MFSITFMHHCAVNGSESYFSQFSVTLKSQQFLVQFDGLKNSWLLNSNARNNLYQIWISYSVLHN